MAIRNREFRGREFVSLPEYELLKKTFGEFAGDSVYQALEYTYESFKSAADTAQKLALANLFSEQLATLLKRKTTPVPPAVDQIPVQLQRYISRLAETVEMLSGVARPAPKIVHFVWVGGSEVGAIQRDYMNIWQQVLASQDYRFNLWYDSDALLAFEMNRVIHDSARLDAMESGGDQVSRLGQLASMIEERARVLKQQLFEHLQQPQWAGRADEARIDLLVRGYGKDRAALESFRQQCLDSHLAMEGPQLRLRDVRLEFAEHFLADVYQREVAMRGNFAAASDVVRLQAEHLEGGRYTDMDYLPPLADRLGGVDISAFNDVQRLGVLQLLLNHDPALMPGRDRHRYPDSTERIPEQHKAALVAFAQGKPGVGELFVAPKVVDVAENGFRMGQQLGAEMNAHFLAQPASGMTLSIMETIRFNYDVLRKVEKTMAASGFAWSQAEQLLTVIENVTNEIRNQANLTAWDDVYLAGLFKAIFGYYQDGIRNEAGGTIVLTGPGAALAGLREYIDAHLDPDALNPVLAQLKLHEGYNFQTEEETVSGWIVKGTDEQWLENERGKWQQGKLKSRYAGQLPELLKEQTLTFRRGWPVIEGKPVLLTSVLQQLMDDLGEPFIEAMREKLSGEIAFDKTVVISFDTRQQILAQPVSELPVSRGADAISHLNELLTKIAHGSLPLEQLSPMARVLLGGVFGASRLDDSGFAETWQTVRKLAVETAAEGTFARYDAVEKQLRQNRSPAFEAGLALSPITATESARALKVMAMSEPLTLRQWGERIGQIKRTARNEFRTQILQRSAQVREIFVAAGAFSARQMSQDLLLGTASEPGRRCYPLALLMGAAVAAGESAERALVGHVATATISPDDVGSRALINALDELRALPTAEIGESRGRQSLESALQTLDANTAPGVLLLDTGDHALLLAKVRVGERMVYRFYDPNFAIYAFANGAQLRRSVEGYLSADDSMLARLYGLGEMASAQFNVIELKTGTIAEQVLASDLRVDSFLQNQIGTDPRSVSVWHRQALARARSLSENAQMGASLTQLDARYWAGEFEAATLRLREEQNLGREYLPLLDTVKPADDGGFRLTLVDAGNAQRTLEVSTRDERFSRVRQHVERLVQVAAGEPRQAGDADGGSRLSFAFALQTLISEMRQRDYQWADQPPALSIALQIQVYVSYAQLGFGVVTDAVQIANLVRQVAAGEQALQQGSLAGRLAGRAATGIGVAFSVANIGFDIYSLSLAQNHEQRAQFSTSLAFNVAALGLDVVALAAGGVVGGVAASLSVPLLGIGIGVTAIASNLGQIMDKAAAIGAHLSEIHDAYESSYTATKGVLQFPPKAIITELDMQRRRVVLDGQKFYPWKGSALELPQYDDDPVRRHTAINIPRAFERPAVASIWGTLPPAVVLPCSPICYYGYEYQIGSAGAVPFSTTRYPQLHDRLAHQLEYDAQGNRVFYLFSTPFAPHILYKLHPVFMATTIKVQLSEEVRQLVVPDLPQEWRKKIVYRITAPQGQYRIRLVPGLVAVNFEQAKGWEQVTWAVQASWARLEQVSFRQKPSDSFNSAPEMLVDGLVLSRFDGIIELAEGLFRVDWLALSLHLVGITLDYGTGQDNAAEQVRITNVATSGIPAPVLNFLHTQVRTGQLTTAYLPLHNFRVPFSPPSRQIVTTAWYDTVRDRVLFARDAPQEVNEGLVLAGVSARHAWFYHQAHPTVWRVDMLTGTVEHRYRLKNPRIGARITGCEQLADGALRVSQKLTAETLHGTTTIEYRITPQHVELTACKVAFAAEDYRFEPREALRQIDVPFADDSPNTAVSTSEWTFAPFMVIEGYAGLRLRDRAWLNRTTGKCTQAEQDLSWPEDLLLLMPSSPENNAVLFYSQQERTISRGIEPRVGRWENVVIERDVVELTQISQRFIATREDGRLFEVDIVDVPAAAAVDEAVALKFGVPSLSNRSDEAWRDQADKPSILRFAGIGQRWLQRNPDWLSALPGLVKTVPSTPVPILGLRDAAGQALLAAWCVEGQIALADIGQGKELSLLGPTPDKKAVWLFEVSAGQLYRQPLVPIEALRGAFSAEHRLLKPQSLLRAEKVWTSWAFGEVQRQGEGLVAQTLDGVHLQLSDNQPAMIVAVENRWAYAPGQNDEQLRARLKALLNGHTHPTVVQVASLPGRYLYYSPKLDRLFDLSGRSDGQWSAFLGTRGSRQPLLFDPVDQLIFSAGAEDGVWLPDSYAHRDDETMALEVAGDVTEIATLLPDGVDRLLLAFGPQTSGYHVSQEAWERLDCIVVDVRQAWDAATSEPCLLVLELAECGHWLMSRVDDDVVLTDPDSGRSLIVRNYDARHPLELVLPVAGLPHSFMLAQGLDAYALARGAEATARLTAVVAALR
ncbi:TcdA/TcdB pore-forming domain-containing protein [Pseudomonas triticicola]|uniref:TcdA/TcdB pore-forming domain-containing protein n=1 Tax=Pseudomonas triticicola TaxID=2842345 RepID=UPI003EBFD6DA